MSGDRLVEMAFLLIALTLPLSALIVRRLPFGQTARLVLIWTVIIVGAAMLITIVQRGLSAHREQQRTPNEEDRSHVHFT